MITDLAKLLPAGRRQSTPAVYGGGIPSPLGYTPKDPQTRQQLAQFIHYTYASVNIRATRIGELAFQMFAISENGDDRKVSGATSRDMARICGANKAKRYVSELGNQRASVLEIESHQFLDIIDYPNPQHERTGFLLKEKTEQHLCLTGNAYWYINFNEMDEPAQFWILQPDRMTAILDKDSGQQAGWSYLRDDGKPVSLPLEQVVHFKMPSPINDIYGWSKIKAAAYAHDTTTFMNIYHRNFFENSARPDFVLTSDQPISEEQAQLILTQWRAEFSGAHRAHLPAVLGNNLKPTALQITNTDLQFIGIAEWTLDQLIAVFGVPKSKLGLVADVNRSNADASDVTFNRETIRPEMLRITEQLQIDVMRRYYDTASVTYDLGFPNPVPDDQELALQRRLEEYKAGFRTLNEARDDAGLEPFSDEVGNRIKIQMQDILVPVDGSSEVFEQMVGIPAIAPPAEPVGVAEDGEDPDEGDRLLLTTGRRSGFESEDLRQTWWMRFVLRSIRGEAKIRVYLTKEFNRQHKALLGAVREELSKTQSARQEDSPFADYIIAQAIDAEVDAEMVRKLRALTRSLLLDEASFVVSALGLDVDITDLNAEVAWYLESKPLRVQGINEVTRDQLRNAIKAWSVEGGSLAELEQAVSGVMEVAVTRARAIARTEAIGALNAGMAAVITEARVEWKEWLSVGDVDVRDTHRAANGQVVRANATFRVGNAQLRYPGDPYTSAVEEIVNCRCTHVPRMTPPKE